MYALYALSPSILAMSRKLPSVKRALTVLVYGLMGIGYLFIHPSMNRTYA